MQYSLLDTIDDHQQHYEGKRVMIGLSGGINSAAVLTHLATRTDYKPETLYCFHANFVEHSPDTLKFVQANVEYAKTHFDNVVYEQDDISLIQFFREQKTIFNPKLSGCTRMLKIEPMVRFMAKHEILIDLVGYVRSEMRRIKRQQAREVTGKEYPIAHLTNEDCFSLVKSEIGWYPVIYDLKWNDVRIIEALDSYGNDLHPQQRNIIRKYAFRGYGYGGTRRVFKHNNCLPCKNMHQWEIFLIRVFYPSYYEAAMKLAEETGSYWGRKSEDNVESDTTCSICAA